MTTETVTLTATKTEGCIKVGIWVGIAAASLLVVLGIVQWHLGHKEFFETAQTATQNDWGNYGSYLQGTTASLWSLAGFFIILVAFLAQKQQLLRQDVELDEQRRQFQLQHESIKQQKFESSFFQLLNLHNQNVKSMRDVSPFAGAVTGLDCFERWYKSFQQFQLTENVPGGGVGPKEGTNIEKYAAFYQSHQGMLGHYFRNLYHVIKFVRTSDINNKRRYTTLARAQLSQYELALLYYNGLTPIPPETTNKFKALIEEFGLLENLNRDLLLKGTDGDTYDAKAFK